MNKRIINYLYLVVGQVGTAICVVLSKLLIANQVSVYVQMQFRFVFVAITLGIALAIFRVYKPSMQIVLQKLNNKDYGILVVQALLAGIVFNFLLLLALQYITATMAGIVGSTLPAIIVLLAWLVLREKISTQNIFCVLLAVIGVAVINTDNSFGASSSGSFIGVFLICLALVSEAFYTILAKMTAKKLSPLFQAFLINLISSVLFIPAWLGADGFSRLLAIGSYDLFIMCLSSIGSLLFYYFWTKGLGRVSGSVAAIYTCVMPISTTIGACLLLGESFTVFDFIGIGFVSLSIVFGSSLLKSRQAPASSDLA